MAILLKRPEEIKLMRRSGKILAQTLDMLTHHVKPGVTTGELDSLAYDFIRSQGAIPSFKGYHPYPIIQAFPGTICASVNEEVVHGIPGKRILEEGDIISLDCGVIYRGWRSDDAITMGVGNIKPELRALIATTEAALNAGIAQAIAGNRVGGISYAVQKRIQQGGRYGIVRDYCGHGLGRNIWEEPSIPNYGSVYEGPYLYNGMVIAIEPMVNLGGDETEVLPDGWTVVTKDRSPSAHFEHTVAITENGPDILTIL